MIEDLELILATVLPTDPSFRAVGREDLDRHIHDARRQALEGSKDDFLLSLMRLLALPGNGHSRLIPNDAISVFPLRFATIGTAVRLVDAAEAYSEAKGGELISVGGVPVADIVVAAEVYLAGTRQRQRVIGPILFAWPGALKHLGVSIGTDPIEFQLRTGTGQISTLLLDTSHAVSGSTVYPRNEHGKPDASWIPEAFLNVVDLGEPGLLMSLPSFFDPVGDALSDAVSEAARVVTSPPGTPVLIDVRGNTGGDFLRTMPLIDALSSGADDRQVVVLVDKFTFSAAIVFVAILKHRLGERLTLVGEEMGDGLTFYAEGGSIDLPTSGAVVRYSSAFHDWATGLTDETTPAEIAERIVPVGALNLDHVWAESSADVESLSRFSKAILASLKP